MNHSSRVSAAVLLSMAACSGSSVPPVPSFTITTSAVHLTLSPPGNLTVKQGDAGVFSITPDNGYVLSRTVGGTCPAGALQDLVYTTGPITADCTVIFTANTVTVTVIGDGHETIDPAGPLTVPPHANLNFNVIPDSGYALSTTVGGTCPPGSFDASGPYFIGNVTADCTVIFTAILIANAVTVTVIGDGHETIDPAGPLTVTLHADLNFNVTPDSGYALSTTVGGTCPPGSFDTSGPYFIGNITADCTVLFTATLITNTVTTTGDGRETISPAAPQKVVPGAAQSFTVTPNAGAAVLQQAGGTCPAGSWSGSTYTTGAITADCTVSFAAAVQVDLSADFTDAAILLEGKVNTSNGFDNQSGGYSAALLQDAASWSSGTVGLVDGVPFALVFPETINIVNAIVCAGQTIALPAGKFAQLAFLGTDAGINAGGQAARKFVVTYDDGSTTTLTQDVSDVQTNNLHLGELVAATMAHRANTAGPAAFLYAYTIPLDPSKTVQGLTLSADSGGAGVSIYAVSLSPIAPVFEVVAIGDNLETISPSGPELLGSGGTAFFTVSALADTQVLGAVGGDCPAGAFSENNGYSMGPITASCHVRFTGRRITLFTVTVSGDGLETFPSTVTVQAGDSATIDVTPIGTALLAATTGTCPRGSLTSSGYVTGPITKNCTVILEAVVGVDLSSFLTIDGIVNAGLTNPTNGIDGGGRGLSASQLLNPSAWDSGTVGRAGTIPFNVVFPSNALHDVQNAVIANGQIIQVPAGKYDAIKILAVDAGIAATGQAGLAFTVTYDDNSTETLLQGFSDVLTKNNAYQNEGPAATTQALVNKDGSAGSGPAFLYEYSIAVDSTKGMKSIQLPNSGAAKGVSIFAISLLPQ
jgi:hypothetical protein